MRVRNNLASALSDDEPVRANDIVAEALGVARDIGDRAMYIWLAGTAAIGSMLEGRDWDAARTTLMEALEMASLPFDRLRLQAMANAIDMARGERLDEIEVFTREPLPVKNIDATFGRLLTRGELALIRSDADGAYRLYGEAVEIRTQDPYAGAEGLLRAAIVSRDPEYVRQAATVVAEIPGSGGLTQALRHTADAAIAAVEVRVADAAAAFARAHGMHQHLGMRYGAALVAVDAITLLPDSPEVRALAESARDVLSELRARPALERLDAALARPSSSPAPEATRTGAQVSG
jgi:hypothetical protein